MGAHAGAGWPDADDARGDGSAEALAAPEGDTPAHPLSAVVKIAIAMAASNRSACILPRS